MVHRRDPAVGRAAPRARTRPARPRSLGGRAAAAALVLATALSGCAPGWLAPVASPSPSPSASAPATPSPSASPREGTQPPAATPSPSPTDPALAWGPTAGELAVATRTAAAMTTADAAGQVIVARFAGTDAAAPAALERDLGLAGVILFRGNVSDAAGVAAIAGAVQTAAAARGRSWPAMVGVDEEGGVVQRLGGPGARGHGDWADFPPFMAAGAAADGRVVRTAMAALGTELRASGITTDFAPVADVTIGPSDPTIGLRSASDDPQRAADTVVAALAGLADAGVLAAPKHFPGHGALPVDSHAVLPVQPASDSRLAGRDLVPFDAGIRAGAPMVMVGHIAVSAWDAGVPASLSAAAYARLRAAGFTGVAVTDSLAMGALAGFGDAGRLAARALAAGADLLLTPTDPAAAVAGIVAAVDAGNLPRARLDEAAGRVIAMLRWQARLADAAGPAPTVAAAAAAARDASAALSAAAVTLVRGSCTGPLVGQRVHLRGGTVPAWNAMAAALGLHGVEVVPLEEPADSTVRLIIGASTADRPADAAVALDWPQRLAASPAPVRIAAFGRTPAALDAAAAVLAGDAVARGTLPVRVDGLATVHC